jgi:hypothetical protein
MTSLENDILVYFNFNNKHSDTGISIFIQISDNNVYDLTIPYYTKDVSTTPYKRIKLFKYLSCFVFHDLII